MKIQFFCDKTSTSIEITGIQLEYAYPENGCSSSGETSVTIYQLHYIHPDVGMHEWIAKHPEDGGNKLLRHGRKYLPIGRHRLEDKDRKHLRDVDIYQLDCRDSKDKGRKFVETSVF